MGGGDEVGDKKGTWATIESANLRRELAIAHTKTSKQHPHAPTRTHPLTADMTRRCPIVLFCDCAWRQRRLPAVSPLAPPAARGRCVPLSSSARVVGPWRRTTQKHSSLQPYRTALQTGIPYRTPRLCDGVGCVCLFSSPAGFEIGHERGRGEGEGQGWAGLVAAVLSSCCLCASALLVVVSGNVSGPATIHRTLGKRADRKSEQGRAPTTHHTFEPRGRKRFPVRRSWRLCQLFPASCSIFATCQLQHFRYLPRAWSAPQFHARKKCHACESCLSGDRSSCEGASHHIITRCEGRSHGGVVHGIGHGHGLHLVESSSIRTQTCARPKPRCVRSPVRLIRAILVWGVEVGLGVNMGTRVCI